LKYHNYGFEGGKNTKKIALLIIVSLVISTGFLSGCNEESSSKKPVSQLMDNFAITLDDLPDGYYKINEDFNDTLYLHLLFTNLSLYLEKL
jgi:hypothetical protein